MDMKITDVMDCPPQMEKIKYFDKGTFEVVEMIRKTINIDYINRMGVVIEYNPDYPILDTIVYKTRDDKIHVLTEEDFNKQFELLSDDVTGHMTRYNKPRGISIRGYEHPTIIAMPPSFNHGSIIIAELDKAGFDVKVGHRDNMDNYIYDENKYILRDMDIIKEGRRISKEIWGKETKLSPREARIKAVQKFNSGQQKKFRTGRK